MTDVTNTSSISPVLDSQEPVVGAALAIGRMLEGINNSQLQIVGATVLQSSSLSDISTSLVSVGFDTDVNTPVLAPSVSGGFPKGTRVLCLLYPPRGVLILGTVNPLARSVPKVFTSNGTLNATDFPGAIALRIRCIGGGGGSGGSPTVTATQSGAGGGGGGGGYAEAVLSTSAVSFPVTITVGAAGAAAAAGSTGGNGGISSFAAQVIATGGAGGGVSGAATAASILTDSAGGGAGTVGQILASGGASSMAFCVTATLPVPAMGGTSMMAGTAGANPNAGGITNGLIGLNYGGGASGPTAGGAITAAKGGQAGAAGVVIIEPIYI